MPQDWTQPIKTKQSLDSCGYKIYEYFPHTYMPPAAQLASFLPNSYLPLTYLQPTTYSYAPAYLPTDLPTTYFPPAYLPPTSFQPLTILRPASSLPCTSLPQSYQLLQLDTYRSPSRLLPTYSPSTSYLLPT